jgi:hypothetical protein
MGGSSLQRQKENSGLFQYLFPRSRVHAVHLMLTFYIKKAIFLPPTGSIILTQLHANALRILYKHLFFVVFALPLQKALL